MTTEISITLKDPSFSLQKDERSHARYTLQFRQKNEFGILETVNVELATADFEVLLNQGRDLAPSQEITLTNAQANATWRAAAWPLLRLGDSELQVWLREVSADQLIYIIWFLKNLDFARKLISNMSARAGACMTEELVQRFHGKDPDEAPASETQTAHECLRDVLDVLARLQDEGQIEKWS